MVERRPEVGHRLPYRIVQEQVTSADGPVQLRRDVPRLTLHPVRVILPGLQQHGDVRLSDLEQIDEYDRGHVRAELLGKWYVRIKRTELEHGIPPVNKRAMVVPDNAGQATAGAAFPRLVFLEFFLRSRLVSWIIPVRWSSAGAPERNTTSRRPPVVALVPSNSP